MSLAACHSLWAPISSRPPQPIGLTAAFRKWPAPASAPTSDSSLGHDSEVDHRPSVSSSLFGGQLRNGHAAKWLPVMIKERQAGGREVIDSGRPAGRLARPDPSDISGDLLLGLELGQTTSLVEGKARRRWGR